MAMYDTENEDMEPHVIDAINERDSVLAQMGRVAVAPRIAPESYRVSGADGSMPKQPDSYMGMTAHARPFSGGPVVSEFVGGESSMRTVDPHYDMGK